VALRRANLFLLPRRVSPPYLGVCSSPPWFYRTCYWVSLPWSYTRIIFPWRHVHIPSFLYVLLTPRWLVVFPPPSHRNFLIRLFFLKRLPFFLRPISVVFAAFPSRNPTPPKPSWPLPFSVVCLDWCFRFFPSLSPNYSSFLSLCR